jgi:hypothetical protein
MAMKRFELIGCHNVLEFAALRSRPASLEMLSLSGLDRLFTIDGIGEWTGLKDFRLINCPRLASLAPLAEVKTLECVGLGSLGVTQIDLRPLAELPALREVSLMGHGDYDLNALAGIPNLTIRVPKGARISGGNKLGSGTMVEEFNLAAIAPSDWAEK